MMNKYLFNFAIGVFVFIFNSLIIYGQDYTDLSLEVTLDQPISEVGSVINFTLELTNNGPTEATDIVVLLQLPTNADLGAFSGNITDDYWDVPTLNALSSVELTGALEITAEGIGFFQAEIIEASPFDYNSTPGNGNTTENDYTSVCYVIPMLICPGEPITLSAPDGFQDYLWYQDGTPIESNGGEVIVYDLGEYHYECTDNNGCPIATPCPFIVSYGEDCTIDLEISAATIGESYQVEDTLMVNYTVSNNGNIDATDISIEIGYSENLEEIAVVSTQGDWDGTHWETDVLEAGEEMQLWFGLLVTAPGAIVSSAYVDAVNESDSDSMPGNTNVFEDDYARVVSEASEASNLPTSLICDFPDAICRLPMLMDQAPTEICLEFCEEGISISTVETSFNCSVQQVSTNCINYLPLPLFEGNDELTFVVCTEDNQVCETITIDLVVSPNCDEMIENRPPVAVSDNYETMVEEAMYVFPLMNDSDPENQVINICDVMQPNFGEVFVEGNQLYYVPEIGYAGMDEFDYMICDEDGMQDIGTVYIEIIRPPCSPDMELCRKPFLEAPQATQLCVTFCDPTMEIQDIDSDFNCSTTNISEQCFSFLPLPLQEGMATVEVLGCNAEGACETAIISIDIFSDCSEDLPRLPLSIESDNLPNILSPNNDGINDVINFNSVLGNSVEWRFLIFDRFGSTVYDAQLGDQAFWNGTYFNEGRLLEDGTYFYLLEYQVGTQGNLVKRSGFIELRK